MRPPVLGRRLRVATGVLLVGSLLAPSGLVPAAHGQEASPTEAAPLDIPTLTGPLRLDGRVDEATWQDVPPLPMTMYEPTYGESVGHRTEIRVAHDDDHLWVGAILRDEAPELVRSNSLYRDRPSGDDLVGVILDAFDDNESGLWFFTNPAGVRFDQEVSQDAEGGFGSPPINDSWDSFWDVRTRRTPEGWEAEFRIPFSSLGFQSDGDEVRMGLLAYRYIARKNERHTFPAIPPEWRFGYAKPSLARTIVLRGVEAEQPLYLTPYLLVGLRSEPIENEAGTAFRSDRSSEREVGLDLKVNLSSNFTLDVTANTDFAQVEADDARVNLTRFDLFFPEKRDFFQERAAIFDFQTGSFSRLFHSRRIGLNEGTRVPLFGGARLVGRAGPWDLGGLSVQSRGIDGLPSENFTVFRARRRVLNRYSYAGVMATSRIGTDGSYNAALGWDAVTRLGEYDYLTAQWVQTIDDAVIDEHGWRPFESSLVRIRWDNRAPRGFTYGGELQRMGEDMRADLGFFPRTDFTRLSGTLGWGWVPGPENPFRSILYNFLFTDGHLRNGDGSLESLVVASMFNFWLKSGASGWVGPQALVEDLRTPLVFPDGTEVPVGRYDFYHLIGSFTTNRQGKLSSRFRARVGSFYDGMRVGLNVSPSLNISRRLEVGGEYNYDRVRFPDRDAGFDAHVGRVRLRAALDTHLSANLFLQYDSVDDLVRPNLRIRYNFREGEDLWIVYDEGFNLDRDRGDIPLPRSSGRTLLVKYTYTFGG